MAPETNRRSARTSRPDDRRLRPRRDPVRTPDRSSSVRWPYSPGHVAAGARQRTGVADAPAARMPARLGDDCLEVSRKAPSKRYGSAAELADDLRRFRDGLRLRLAPPAASNNSSNGPGRRPAVASLLAPSCSSLWRRRHRHLSLALPRPARSRMPRSPEARRCRPRSRNDRTRKDCPRPPKSQPPNAQRRPRPSKRRKERPQERRFAGRKLLLLAQTDYSQTAWTKRANTADDSERYRAAPWRLLQRHVSAPARQLQIETQIYHLVFSPNTDTSACFPRGDKDNVRVWEPATARSSFAARPPMSWAFFSRRQPEIGVVTLPDMPDRKQERSSLTPSLDGQPGKDGEMSDRRRPPSAGPCRARMVVSIVFSQWAAPIPRLGPRFQPNFACLTTAIGQLLPPECGWQTVRPCLTTSGRHRHLGLPNSRFWQQKKLEREFRGDVAGLTLSPDPLIYRQSSIAADWTTHTPSCTTPDGQKAMGTQASRSDQWRANFPR